jgi:GNAT superfamily N-acetyltransferase
MEPLDEGGHDKPLYFADAKDSPPELHSHAILLSRDAFGVGIVVLERRPIVDFYKWNPRRCVEFVGNLPETIRWSVIHVWLLPQLRGRGVASELVRTAIEGVNEVPDTVGWLSPYTRKGRDLIARVTKLGFHRAVCDLPPPEVVERPFRRANERLGRLS